MNDEDSAHRLARVLAYSKVITERIDTPLARVLRASVLMQESPGMRAMRAAQKLLPPYLAESHQYEAEARERLGSRESSTSEYANSQLEPPPLLELTATATTNVSTPVSELVNLMQGTCTPKTWRINTPKLKHGYDAPLRLALEHFWKLDPENRPATRSVYEYLEKTVSQHPELAKVEQNEITFYDAKGDLKTASFAALHQSIKRRVVFDKSS